MITEARAGVTTAVGEWLRELAALPPDEQFTHAVAMDDYLTAVRDVAQDIVTGCLLPGSVFDVIDRQGRL